MYTHAVRLRRVSIRHVLNLTVRPQLKVPVSGPRNPIAFWVFYLFRNKCEFVLLFPQQLKVPVLGASGPEI